MTRSCHLLADCQEPGLPPEPYGIRSVIVYGLPLPFFTVKMASPDTLHCPLLAVPNVIRCTNRHVAFWRAGISVPTVELTFRLSVAPQTMNLFCHKAQLCISIFLTYLMLLMCQCSGMISLKLHCNFIKPSLKVKSITSSCCLTAFFKFKISRLVVTTERERLEIVEASSVIIIINNNKHVCIAP